MTSDDIDGARNRYGDATAAYEDASRRLATASVADDGLMLAYQVAMHDLNAALKDYQDARRER